MERSKRGILRKSEVILVDTGGMLPQRERCTQGHAKRETAMFYFINPDITIFISVIMPVALLFVESSNISPLEG